MDAIAILAPTEPIADFLLEGLSVRESPESGGFVFHTGTHSGRRVFIGFYGPSPGDAAAVAQQLMSYSNARGLLALGFAFAPGANTGSLLVARDTICHDNAAGNSYAAFLKNAYTGFPANASASNKNNPVFAHKSYRSAPLFADTALSACALLGQPAVEENLVSPITLPSSYEELQHILQASHTFAMCPFSCIFASVAARHAALYAPLCLVLDAREVLREGFSLSSSAQAGLAAAAGAFLDALHVLA